MEIFPRTSFIMAALLTGGAAMAQAEEALVLAQAPAHGQQASSAAHYPERSVSEWLLRMHEASKLRSYIGTFVVLSNNGSMSSARIWHACEGDQQVERVESLTGAPRSTFRRNNEVVTFLPELRVARTEKRESLGLFPNLIKSSDSSIPDFYSARRLGGDRVAGFAADVVQLAPKDNLRYGYRIWSERKSGLVVKLQTIDADGTVLEQAAFSELQLDAPVRIDKLNQMMSATEGWRIEKAEALKTTAAAEGWHLKSAIAGFKPINCYKRPVGAGGAGSDGAIHWIFSDGLAAVSLFVEQYDAKRHAQEGIFASGATQTLTRRIQDWWLTAVGEVPSQTLNAFAQSLERRK
ncbi:MucB/RseB C-terminal domain-containing protein [Caenimonas sp. SL110]|uniref:MucB/RseB C-terminal domain-containing protein n=1 Tax=Caenimonas sp. SL110 TaxID=1450524 RepID=UPI0009E3D3DF|nr:MucB/RseB C-terminal domain-containing protein [Caenimonas sp. SL110]